MKSRKLKRTTHPKLLPVFTAFFISLLICILSIKEARAQSSAERQAMESVRAAANFVVAKQWRKAEAAYGNCSDLFSKLQKPLQSVNCLTGRAGARVQLGKTDEAQKDYVQSARVLRGLLSSEEAKSPGKKKPLQRAYSSALFGLSELAVLDKDYPKAEKFLIFQGQVLQSLNDQNPVALAYNKEKLAELAVYQNDFKKASKNYREARKHYKRSNKIYPNDMIQKNVERSELGARKAKEVGRAGGLGNGVASAKKFFQSITAASAQAAEQAPAAKRTQQASSVGASNNLRRQRTNTAAQSVGATSTTSKASRSNSSATANSSSKSAQRAKQKPKPRKPRDSSENPGAYGFIAGIIGLLIIAKIINAIRSAIQGDFRGHPHPDRRQESDTVGYRPNPFNFTGAINRSEPLGYEKRSRIR